MMNAIITTNIKRLTLPFLLIIALILSGCAEDGTSAEDNSPPKGVQDGTVSQDYYDSLQKFSIKSLVFWNQIQAMDLENRTNPPDTDEEIAKVGEFTEVIKEYNLFNESFKTTPVTDADKEIDEVLVKIQKKYGEYGLSFGLSYMGIGDTSMYKLWEQTRDELDDLLYELEDMEEKHLISIY